MTPDELRDFVIWDMEMDAGALEKALDLVMDAWFARFAHKDDHGTP